MSSLFRTACNDRYLNVNSKYLYHLRKVMIAFACRLWKVIDIKDKEKRAWDGTLWNTASNLLGYKGRSIKLNELFAICKSGPNPFKG